jgi:hypothetical protein
LLLRLDAEVARHLESLGARLAETMTGVFEAAASQALAAPEAARALVEAEASRLAARAESDVARDARLDAVVAALDRTAEDVRASLHQQGERLTAWSADLGARLDAHAGGLESRLAGTSDVVREAADLARAGGAELSAVAEMFALSVDRYRESNERILTTLARVDEALGAGGGESGALVGEYLDQTREVFGDALRFQRELFTELRALRGQTVEAAG